MSSSVTTPTSTCADGPKEYFSVPTARAFRSRKLDDWREVAAKTESPADAGRKVWSPYPVRSTPPALACPNRWLVAPSRTAMPWSKYDSGSGYQSHGRNSTSASSGWRMTIETWSSRVAPWTVIRTCPAAFAWRMNPVS